MGVFKDASFVAAQRANEHDVIVLPEPGGDTSYSTRAFVPAVSSTTSEADKYLVASRATVWGWLMIGLVCFMAGVGVGVCGTLAWLTHLW